MIDLKEGAIIAVDKPLSWSSFQLLNKFRCEACRHIGVKKLKVGHAGTLDPLATGVMILCTGKATKQIEKLQQGDKEYIATIKLGATTPSFDKETEEDQSYPTDHINEKDIIATLKTFVGQIEQIPPMFSAVKVDGKRAYKLARQGQEVALKAKQVRIDTLELIQYHHPIITIRVVCSKGTYIRSLARDIGLQLNSGGYLLSLQRTRVGVYHLNDCLKIDTIKDWLHNNVEKNIADR